MTAGWQTVYHLARGGLAVPGVEFCAAAELHWHGQEAGLAHMLTPANMLSAEAIAPEPDAHTHTHTQPRLKTSRWISQQQQHKKPQRVPPGPGAETRRGYSRLNTWRRVLVVKSRFSHVALTFAVVKQHFCWLTVPPCYSRCANQCWVFIWLVAAILPHTKTTSRGSGQEQVTYPPGGSWATSTETYLLCTGGVEAQ